MAGTPAVPEGRSRIAAAVSGAALVGASVATRWGVFHAGLASARDPKYTVVPQRERLRERARAAAAGAPPPAAVPPAEVTAAPPVCRLLSRAAGGQVRRDAQRRAR